MNEGQGGDDGGENGWCEVGVSEGENVMNAENADKDLDQDEGVIGGNGAGHDLRKIN